MEGQTKEDPRRCAACLNNIGDCDYVTALAKDWHKDCFRCSVCDAELSSWYFEKGGLLFCEAHYWERFGETCQNCQQVMTGPVMSAGRHRFHPECFRCRVCAGHVEDGQPYALLDRKHLYCGQCYETRGRGQAGPSHAIRVLHLPPTKLRLQPDKDSFIVTQCRAWAKCCELLRGLLRAGAALCLQLPCHGYRLLCHGYHLPCHRIDSPGGLLTLRLGDRVLEVDGVPVSQHSPPEVEARIASSDTVLQLTVEQRSDPKVTSITERTRAGENNTHSTSELPERATDEQSSEGVEGAGRRERLFRRRGGEAGAARGRGGARRRQPASPAPASPSAASPLRDKERSSSMSRLLDVGRAEREGLEAGEGEGGGRGARARSFRQQPGLPRVFRPADLQLGELLGCGFFGEVYRVVSRESGEVMVLKQLYRLDDAAQENFLKEVAVLRALQHPNVLRFVGVLYKEKRLHLVTEYVAGGTLHQLLQDQSVELSWETRARLARDVSAGLGYLHRRNVIHRDLNSHNCLVREDKSVVVADFGLARVVRGTASSRRPPSPRRLGRHDARRKRYTVVGNPYWMAPEMMNGDEYDEKVDVFSFGIILCEIIGRVSADPDYLPRRADFGLHEAQFVAQYCVGAPAPLVAAACLACHLHPDHRPPFEVMEIWLETLVMSLSQGAGGRGEVGGAGGRGEVGGAGGRGEVGGALLADIRQYARRLRPAHRCDSCADYTPQHACVQCGVDGDRVYCHQNSTSDLCRCEGGGPEGGEGCSMMKHATSTVGSGDLTEGVVKSQSVSRLAPLALGKCVSAGHIGAGRPPAPRPPAPPPLSRSHLSLAPGYLLHACGNYINITKVDDISQYLSPPPPLKRSSPAAQLHTLAQDTKARRLQHDHTLPCYLRNQSCEGLETSSQPLADSDSSDDDLTDSRWYKNVSAFQKINNTDAEQPKNIISGIVKKGELLLSKKASYDVTDAPKDAGDVKGNKKKSNELKAAETSTAGPTVEQKVDKKENYFSKKLMSPKLSRLFRSAEPRRPAAEKPDKATSRFFVQRPASPAPGSAPCRSTYRVRPADDKLNNKLKENVIKSDLKLASLGAPMTPVFRRAAAGGQTARAGGQGARASYRDARYKCDSPATHCDVIRRVMSPPSLAPLVRSPPTADLPALADIADKYAKQLNYKNKGISKSNYVNLANLKINSSKESSSPVEGARANLAPAGKVV